MITVAQGIADPVAAGIISRTYTAKWNKLNWPKDVIADITSSAYFDDIKQKGDRVTVPIEPIVPVNTFTEGAAANPTRLVPSTMELVIDQAWNWDIALGPGTKEFAYVDLLAAYGEGGRKSASKKVHTEFFSWLQNQCAAANRGATAGVKTATWNLGTQAAPVKVTPANIVATLLKFTGVFGEQDIDQEEIAIVLPWSLNWLFLQSELKSASISGDDKSKLVTGYMGTLGGREKFYVTNYVTGSGTHADPFCVYAMTKQGVAYTSRLTNTRLYELANWDVCSQGLGIWGRGVVKDWAISQMWLEIDSAYAPSA